MAGQSNAAPVIIKRKKVIAGGGHHGGAWKVAYADFVTAMMAFFMLMWLISATTEEQRKGIADYFNPTIFITQSALGGDGVFKGYSLRKQETADPLGAVTILARISDDEAALKSKVLASGLSVSQLVSTAWAAARSSAASSFGSRGL